MIRTLRDYLVTQLKTTSLGDNVYGYVVSNPEDNNVVYPYAYVDYRGSTAEWESNQMTERHYQFVIRVLFEVTSGLKTLEAIDDGLFDIVDSIHTLFDNKRCADANAHVLSVDSTEAGWAQSITGVRYLDVNVTFISYINLV